MIKTISFPAVLMISGWALSVLYGLDPRGNSWGAIESPFLKYIPSMMGFLAILLILIIKGKIRWYWTLENSSLFCFMLFVLAGSLFALLFKGQPLSATFMGVGINGISFLFSFYFFSAAGSEVEKKTWQWLTTISVFAAGWVAIATTLRALNLGFTEVVTLYHEEFFLVPCVLLLFANLKKVYLTLVLAILAALLGALSAKFTGFLTSALVSGYLLWITWKAGKKKEFFIIRIFSLWLMGFFLALTVFVVLQMPSVLPSGSPGVRLITYAARLTEFLQSPIWGQSFTGSAEFTLPTQDGFVVLPSHSDILDIASQGGALGLFLFLFPIYKIGMRIVPSFLSGGIVLERYQKFALFLVATFFLMSIFNPVLKQPGLSYLFWVALGYLASLKTVNDISI